MRFALHMAQFASSELTLFPIKLIAIKQLPMLIDLNSIQINQHLTEPNNIGL